MILLSVLSMILKTRRTLYFIVDEIKKTGVKSGERGGYRQGSFLAIYLSFFLLNCHTL